MPSAIVELSSGASGQTTVMNSEAVDLRACLETAIPSLPLGIQLALGSSWKGNTVSMTRTNDTISEIIRNPKHPFRKADDRPVKAQKHRYERRKIKEFIRLGDWSQEGLG
jgi:hypothetical protein